MVLIGKILESKKKQKTSELNFYTSQSGEQIHLKFLIGLCRASKQNPIPSFHLPVHLSDWFPQQRMKTKRDEIRELILKIQQQQELDRSRAARQPAPPGSPREPEIKETSGSTGRPPSLVSR